MDPLTPRRLSHNLNMARVQHDRHLRRITCQLDFAQALVEARPDAPTEWRSAIAEAQKLIDSAGTDVDLPALAGTVEAALSPLAEFAKSFTIHCVGHGHLDMNWMWSWPETVAATHDTFASVLSLMRAYPELTYSQSQASVYALIEKYHPSMFAEIVQRVKEGRWEVTATQWVEGDKNLVNGESLMRHYLYAREFCLERFGLRTDDMPVQWEPDTFGHANTMPMIAAHGGVKYYYSCRTGGGFSHERVGEERPPLFWWEAPDGSRVLVNREISWYNSYVNIGDNIALPAVQFFAANGLHDWLNVYGFGNHGGGPTRKEIDYYLEMRSWPIYPRIEFSTSKRFFDKVAAAIAHPDSRYRVPTLQHELNFEFTGCYTSQSLIKQANRLGENLCLEAEALNAMAHSLCRSPRGSLRDAWLNVLFNQFHDILPGSGVRQTREHACALFQETAAITSASKREAMRSIAEQIDTVRLLPNTSEGVTERETVSQSAPGDYEAGPGMGSGLTGHSRTSGGGTRFKPVVIFNSLAWDREDVVTVSLWDTDFDPSLIVALDENGIAHPTFLVEDTEEWGHHRKSVLFYAKVPALGYRTYLMTEGKAQPEPVVRVLDETTLESDFLRLQFLRYDGGLGEICKRDGTSYGDSFGQWHLHHERPRFMTAWVLGDEEERGFDKLHARRFDLFGEARNAGTLAASGANIFMLGTHHHDLTENGSKATIRALVHSKKPRIDFSAELDWREIGTPDRGIPGLAVHFHLAAWEQPNVFETPFGSIERETNSEVPMLRWQHIPGEAGGVTLLSDGKSGTGGDGWCRFLRIVRSSYDPDPIPEVNQQTFRYGLYFHDVPPTKAELCRLGMEFNHPLIVHPTTFHTGDLPASASTIGDGGPFVVSSVKIAEDGTGVVVRFVDVDGVGGQLPAWCHRGTSVDAMECPTGEDLSVTPFGMKTVLLHS